MLDTVEVNLPLVSVVMPSLNQHRFVNEAIHSVLSQSYTRIELIVADGGSEDGTIGTLKLISAQDNRLNWFSEADTGPANAVNNALLRARGTIIGWLNSDDVYAPNAISHAVSYFQAHPELILLYGHGDHIDDSGQAIDSYPTLPPTSKSLTEFENGCFICQPTVFFKSTAKLLLGDLNESLKTAFDFDYWVRAFKAFPDRIGFVDSLLAKSRLHKDCITLSQRRQVCLESMSVISRHMGDPPPHWLISYADDQRSRYKALSIEEIRSDLYQMINMLHPQPSDIGLNRLRWVVENYG